MCRADRRPACCRQCAAKRGHDGGGFETVAHNDGDGEAVVGQVDGVVPVAADVQGADRGEVADHEVGVVAQVGGRGTAASLLGGDSNSAFAGTCGAAQPTTDPSASSPSAPESPRTGHPRAVRGGSALIGGLARAGVPEQIAEELEGAGRRRDGRRSGDREDFRPSQANCTEGYTAFWLASGPPPLSLVSSTPGATCEPVVLVSARGGSGQASILLAITVAGLDEQGQQRIR